ncbi:uncharacterized protein V1518DRAFT_411028 [Limtongia smithiae]|uniref:uncharacterized protein n=1 Tax=Limtongia smithiae TaxID=1125753 RepID=UPI0034CF078A
MFHTPNYIGSLQERAASLTEQIDLATMSFRRVRLPAAVLCVVLPAFASLAACFLPLLDYRTIGAFYAEASTPVVLSFLGLQFGLILGVMTLRNLVGDIVPRFWALVVAGMVVLTTLGFSNGEVFLCFFSSKDVLTESIVVSVMRFFHNASGVESVFYAAEVLANIFPRVLFLACYSAHLVVSAAIARHNLRLLVLKIQLRRIQHAQVVSDVLSAEEGTFRSYSDEVVAEKIEN